MTACEDRVASGEWILIYYLKITITVTITMTLTITTKNIRGDMDKI